MRWEWDGVLVFFASFGWLPGLVGSASDDRKVRVPGRYALLYLIRTLIRFSHSIMGSSHSVRGWMNGWIACMHGLGSKARHFISSENYVWVVILILLVKNDSTEIRYGVGVG